MLCPSHCESGMVFAVNPTATNTFDAFKVCSALCVLVSFPVADFYSLQARAMGTNTTSSSPGSSSTKSVPSQSGSSSSPSASGYSNSAPLRFDSSKLTGIIGLVAVVAGSVL